MSKLISWLQKHVSKAIPDRPITGPDIVRLHTLLTDVGEAHLTGDDAAFVANLAGIKHNDLLDVLVDFLRDHPKAMDIAAANGWNTVGSTALEALITEAKKLLVSGKV
jgi:hypothetical protein